MYKKDLLYKLNESTKVLAISEFMLKELQQKVEQLENIRKEAIEYIGNPLDNYWEEEAKHLLNILNKGSESDD